jgi:hypothetical protein
MKRTLANIGCYSVVAVLTIGSVVSLLGSARGRSVLGFIFEISEIKSLLSPFTGDVSGLLSQKRPRQGDSNDTSCRLGCLSDVTHDHFH